MIEVLQNSENDCNKKPHSTELTQDFHWKWDIFHVCGFNIKRNEKLENHNVTEVKCNVVKLFVNLAEFREKSLEFSPYFLVFHLIFYSLHFGFENVQNEKNHRENHENSRVCQVIHEKRFTHAQVSVLVESKVSNVRDAFLLVNHLIKTHRVLERQNSGESLWPVSVLINEQKRKVNHLKWVESLHGNKLVRKEEKYDKKVKTNDDVHFNLINFLVLVNKIADD